jgi:crotonobetaine/carnitine-CoA ligase
VAAHAKHLKWIAVTEDDSGEPAQPRAREEGGAERIAFAELVGDAAALPDRAAEPMLPVGIMFTSGTTSRPKAVVHTHANVIWASRVGPDNIAIGPTTGT